MSVIGKRKGKSAEYLAIRIRRALEEEAQRIRELEDEDVAAFRALQRLEEMVNEIPPRGGTTGSEDRARAVASIQRLRTLLDMRCAELANVWQPRVEGLILDMAELRLLTSGKDPETP